MISDRFIKRFKRQSLKDKANEIAAKTVCDRTMTPSADAVFNVFDRNKPSKEEHNAKSGNVKNDDHNRP